MLEHLGYSVSTAIDGREGIERYRARPFDLVIADVFMPKKDGLQVIREIIDELPDARFIAMSGAGSYGDSLLEARSTPSANPSILKICSRLYSEKSAVPSC